MKIINIKTTHYVKSVVGYRIHEVRFQKELRGWAFHAIKRKIDRARERHAELYPTTPESEVSGVPALSITLGRGMYNLECYVKFCSDQVAVLDSGLIRFVITRRDNRQLTRKLTSKLTGN